MDPFEALAASRAPNVGLIGDREERDSPEISLSNLMEPPVLAPPVLLSKFAPRANKLPTRDYWNRLWYRHSEEALTRMHLPKILIVWNFVWLDKEHRVELAHSKVSGKRKVSVNGLVEFMGKIPGRQEIRLAVGGREKPATVLVASNAGRFQYELYLGGVDFDSAKEHWIDCIMNNGVAPPPPPPETFLWYKEQFSSMTRARCRKDTVIWGLSLEGTKYEVRVCFSYGSGKTEITVNGNVVYSRKSIFVATQHTRFRLGESPSLSRLKPSEKVAALSIAPVANQYVFNLSIGGVPFDTARAKFMAGVELANSL
jgi:hypothetical protein